MRINSNRWSVCPRRDADCRCREIGRRSSEEKEKKRWATLRALNIGFSLSLFNIIFDHPTTWKRAQCHLLISHASYSPSWFTYPSSWFMSPWFLVCALLHCLSLHVLKLIVFADSTFISLLLSFHLFNPKPEPTAKPSGYAICAFTLFLQLTGTK